MIGNNGDLILKKFFLHKQVFCTSICAWPFHTLRAMLISSITVPEMKRKINVNDGHSKIVIPPNTRRSYLWADVGESITIKKERLDWFLMITRFWATIYHSLWFPMNWVSEFALSLHLNCSLFQLGMFQNLRDALRRSLSKPRFVWHWWIDCNCCQTAWCPAEFTIKRQWRTAWYKLTLRNLWAICCHWNVKTGKITWQVLSALDSSKQQCLDK